MHGRSQFLVRWTWFSLAGWTILAFLAAGLSRPAQAYAVLSHEEVVDMAWTGQLLPLLKQRFPSLTDDQIKEAHAYAYGGSVIQDIGYYPFGDKPFSDLLHYVRTGDFVMALLRDASTPDELAFALGALAHYYGDTVGHPIVNQVTAEEYPALRKRFGRTVTYDQDPTAHLRTEFGFDVVEVAQGNYSQQNYRDFIGFQVAKPLLERAFQETYGLPLSSVLTREDLAISTYRYSVSSLIPKMTHVALINYQGKIATANPGYDRKKFVFRLRNTEFRKQYGKQYEKPGFWAHIVAFFVRLVPKVGPFRALQLKLPTASEQTEYLHSINAVEDAYQATLKTLIPTVAEPPMIADIDLDTGKPVAEGEYALADRSYAFLVKQLAKDGVAKPPADVLGNIETFYANPAAQDAVKAKPKAWAELQAALAKLKQAQVTPAQPVAAAKLVD